MILALWKPKCNSEDQLLLAVAYVTVEGTEALRTLSQTADMGVARDTEGDKGADFTAYLSHRGGSLGLRFDFNTPQTHLGYCVGDLIKLLFHCWLKEK